MSLGDCDKRTALFDQVYDAHHQGVYAYLLARTNNPATAMDLLQETFLKVWRHIDKVVDADDDRRRYWLFHISKNVVADYYRRRERRRSAVEQVTLDDCAHFSEPADPEHAYEVKESLREVDTAIRALPEELRVPLIMQVLGGMTSTEIGAILGRPPGTIRYQITRARRRLAESLKQNSRMWEGH